MVSITEHADDTPYRQAHGSHHRKRGRVLQRESGPGSHARGLREAASRGFWVASRVPYGYRKVMVQDGAKKRPKLEPVEGEASLVTENVQHGRGWQERPGHREDTQL